MIKKENGLFYPCCDVCLALGVPAPEFMLAVESKRQAGWESKRYRRDGAWYDVCPACLEEQEQLHRQGKKNLFDIL